MPSSFLPHHILFWEEPFWEESFREESFWEESFWEEGLRLNFIYLNLILKNADPKMPTFLGARSRPLSMSVRYFLS